VITAEVDKLLSVAVVDKLLSVAVVDNPLLTARGVVNKETGKLLLLP